MKPKTPLQYISRPSTHAWPVVAVYNKEHLWFNKSPIHSRTKKIRNWLFKKNRPAQGIDVLQLFSKASKKIWTSEIQTGTDLFLALLKDPEVQELFRRFGSNSHDGIIFLRNYRKLSAIHEPKDLLYKLPFYAYTEQITLGQREITPLVLFCALAGLTPQEHVLYSILENIQASYCSCQVVACWILNRKGSNHAQPQLTPHHQLLFETCLKASLIEPVCKCYFTFPAITLASHLTGKNAPQLLKLLVRSAARGKATTHIKIITASTIAEITKPSTIM